MRGFTIEPNGVYRAGDLVMVPGAVERILVFIYYSMESQRLMDITFHEGGKPTLRWFLNEYMSPERSTLLCYRKSQFGAFDGLNPVGFGWINKTWPIGVNFRKAETGMVFLRKIPMEDTLELARMMIGWAFNNLALDVLLGSTPSPNRAAVLFGQKLGFLQSTPVQGWTCFNGKLCSAVIQSLTRDRWNELSRSQSLEAA